MFSFMAAGSARDVSKRLEFEAAFPETRVLVLTCAFCIQVVWSISDSCKCTPGNNPAKELL